MNKIAAIMIACLALAGCSHRQSGCPGGKCPLNHVDSTPQTIAVPIPEVTIEDRVTAILDEQPPARISEPEAAHRAVTRYIPAAYETEPQGEPPQRKPNPPVTYGD